MGERIKKKMVEMGFCAREMKNREMGVKWGLRRQCGGMVVAQ
jgi:hypothetical protein